MKAKFNKILKKFSRSSTSTQANHSASNKKKALSSNLRQNIEQIEATLGNSTDIIVRQIRLGNKGQIKASVFFTDGLSDTKSISQFIIQPLMSELRHEQLSKEFISAKDPFAFLKEHVLTVSDIKDIEDFEALYTFLLSGDTIMLIDGQTQGLAIAMREWDERGVTEPEAQTVIRGPREGFSESLRSNTALLRRKIKDPNLWLESKEVGRVTKTQIGIMYLKNIANEQLVKEIRKRLDQIDIDSILESGYIEQLIEDKSFTPFPVIYNTERPDVVAAEVLEGRVAIFVDGTPFVLVAPATFVQFFQAAEDYYQRSDFGLIRLLRYISLFVALLGSALYVAVTTFHQEILPTKLLYTLAAQREGIPFPAFVEALVMETIFEILREAGVRMPRAVGQAISIVGGLVIGQAAVEAGLVSSAMVIVLAITAISSFTFASFNMGIAIRVLRFVLLVLAATFGLYGIGLGVIAIVLHLCNLRSFGVPYMTGYAPFVLSDQKDAIIVLPRWAMYTRPRYLNQKNPIRQESAPATKPNSKKEQK